MVTLLFLVNLLVTLLGTISELHPRFINKIIAKWASQNHDKVVGAQTRCNQLRYLLRSKCKSINFN